MLGLHVCVRYAPGWIWAFLAATLLFLGVLYSVPEARQWIGPFLAGSRSVILESDPAKPGTVLHETERQAKVTCDSNSDEFIIPAFPGESGHWTCKD
jgi:hypothetical protein